MPTILNKFEFEFFFHELFARYRDTAPNPLKLPSAKETISTSCQHYSGELSNGHLQSFHRALMKSDQVTVF